MAIASHASGVNPSTMSNFAASSPIFESFIGAKSTVTDVAGLRVADALIDAVRSLSGLALDVALRRQQLLAGLA